MNSHVIKQVEAGSIAHEMGLVAGDELLKIDAVYPVDILDYRYMLMSDYVEILIRKPSGEEWLLEIDKNADEDIGLHFADGLMDAYRSCQNNCIFCFMDQMPSGLRESLYFKDDDERLSFFRGNYITLTNMSTDEIERIIRYRLEPINISIHTTNPALRIKMMNNPRAGAALLLIDKLYAAGIKMNGQIVLCKGINDGDELIRSITDLSAYLPHMESVSVVPSGLTKHRAGLYPLEPFDKADAGRVIDCIESHGRKFYEKWHNHFIHAADEWYLLAGRPLPPADMYDGYPQLENGVGMLRLFEDEFADALKVALTGTEPDPPSSQSSMAPQGTISIATGTLAYESILSMSERLMSHFPGLSIQVYAVTNHFFGDSVSVSGLLTGADLISQLRGQDLGERLLLPENIVKSDEDIFLDGTSVADVEKALQVRVDIVKSSGYEFVRAVTSGQ